MTNQVEVYCNEKQSFTLTKLKLCYNDPKFWDDFEAFLNENTIQKDFIDETVIEKSIELFSNVLYDNPVLTQQLLHIAEKIAKRITNLNHAQLIFSTEHPWLHYYISIFASLQIQHTESKHVIQYYYLIWTYSTRIIQHKKVKFNFHMKTKLLNVDPKLAMHYMSTFQKTTFEHENSDEFWTILESMSSINRESLTKFKQFEYQIGTFKSGLGL